MSLIICRDCGKEHSDTAKACPTCGARPLKSKVWMWCVLALLAAFIAFGALSKRAAPLLDAASPNKNAPPGSSGEMQRLVDHAKVDQCWQDAAHAPISTLQYDQATCKNLEDEFTKKYNTRF
jgi:hypothetical protein